MKVLSGISVLLFLIALVPGIYGIYTKGNKIYYNNGQQAILRGVARPSLEWSSTGEHLSLADYQLMQGWGSNVVRVGLSQCFWLSGHTNYDPNYAPLIDTQVSQITGLGMAVILDLHWSDQGSMSGTCGQQIMADTNSITFWEQVSARYANNPLVLYELYNEPHDVTWDLWRNGGSAAFTVVGMQKLYDTVRKHANNTVVIGGLGYGYDLSQVPTYNITGFNIVYNTHPYNFVGKQPGDWPTSFGFLSGTYPLIATEFGDFDCTTGYYISFINYAASIGMSWTGWGWYVNGCSFPSLISDWNGTPNAPGAVVKAALGGNGTYGGTTGNAGPGTTYQVYTDQVNNPWEDWSWASTRNAADTTYVHSGTHSYSFVPDSYNAVYFYCSACINTANTAGIEFYVNGGTTGGQNVHFNLIRYEGGSSNKYGPDQALSYYTGGNVAANKWSKGYVDLSTFPSGTYDGFWFEDNSGSTQGTIYIDDITVYASDTSTSTGSGTTAGSSGTTGGTGTTYQTYTDQVNNPWEDWSWASTRNAADTTYVHSGTHSYSFVPDSYNAVYFYCTGCISTDLVEFYVNGGTTGGQNVHFNLIRYEGGSSNKYGPDQDVSYYAGTIEANKWSKGSVDLSTFPSGTYDGFWFEDTSGSTQGTLYIDDVTVYAKGGASTSTGGKTGTTGKATTANSSGAADSQSESSASSMSSVGIIVGAFVGIIGICLF